MGFAVPLAKSFRGPLKQELRGVLLESPLAQSGVFEQSYFEKLVDEHQSGLREHRAILWA
jgi:asparagine synthase (glutamine-hydrolysing)